MPDDLSHPDPADTDPAAHGPEAALRLQVNRQQGQLDRQAARLDEQIVQIATLAARLRDSDARIVAQSHAVQTLHHEVAALRGSTSWRITAPLRGLRRGLWWLWRLWRGAA